MSKPRFDGLPNPQSITDEYLANILDELRFIRHHLPKPEAPYVDPNQRPLPFETDAPLPDDVVVVQEPDRGFPEGVPFKQMTAVQQAAYKAFKKTEKAALKATK